MNPILELLSNLTQQPLFYPTAKRYDPDDYEEGKPYMTLREAVDWCAKQRVYGYGSAWIRCGSVEKRLQDITLGEIEQNKLEA